MPQRLQELRQVQARLRDQRPVRHQQLRLLRQEVRACEVHRRQVLRRLLQVHVQARVDQLRQEVVQRLRGGHQQRRVQLWRMRPSLPAGEECVHQVPERPVLRAGVQEGVGQLPRQDQAQRVRDGPEQRRGQLRRVRAQVPVRAEGRRAHVQPRQVRRAVQEGQQVRQREEVVRAGAEVLAQLIPRASSEGRESVGERRCLQPAAWRSGGSGVVGSDV